MNKKANKKTKDKKSAVTYLLLMSAIFAFMVFLCACNEQIVYDSDTEPEVICSHPSFLLDAARAPISLLCVTDQSDDISEIEIEYGRTVKCVKCSCEVLYLSDFVKERDFRFSDFCGVIYVPCGYKYDFTPGSVVLVDLLPVKGGEIKYMPLLDELNRLQYLPFKDEKLVVGPYYPGSLDFYCLERVNDAIDQVKELKDKPEWAKILYDKKLENGMSVEEVREYLESILPAVEKGMNNSEPD